MKQDEQSREEWNRKQPMQSLASYSICISPPVSHSPAATWLENSVLDLADDLRKDFKNKEVLLFPS